MLNEPSQANRTVFDAMTTTLSTSSSAAGNQQEQQATETTEGFGSVVGGSSEGATAAIQTVRSSPISSLSLSASPTTAAAAAASMIMTTSASSLNSGQNCTTTPGGLVNSTAAPVSASCNSSSSSSSSSTSSSSSSSSSSPQPQIAVTSTATSAISAALAASGTSIASQLQNPPNLSNSIATEISTTLTPVTHISTTAAAAIVANSDECSIGVMNIKEESSLIENTQIKRENESPLTGGHITPPVIKKEPIQRHNSNDSTSGGPAVIGSTNTGSLHHNSSSLKAEDDLILPKDELLADNPTAIGVGSTIASMVNVKKEDPGPDLVTDGFGGLGGIVGSDNLSSGCGPLGSRILPTDSGQQQQQQQPQLNSNLLGGSGSSGNKGGYNGGSGGGNAMDYMQQQRHIFVFSTQLANKGAESVLSGQYSTIIAYHCAQPTTKKFLEEFFHKNPMKMSKFNRQNSAQWLNNLAGSTAVAMMSGPGGAGSGLGSQQKSNKHHNSQTANTNGGGCGTNANGSTNRAKSNQPHGPQSILAPASGFSGGDDLTTTDPTDLLPWEQNAANHLRLDGMANGNNVLTSNSGGPHSVGDTSMNLDCTESLGGSSPSLNPTRGGLRNSSSAASTGPSTATAMQQQSPTAVSSLGPSSPSLAGGGIQPSLQGVKVPNENLTPQQRQHREEQLAKIQKINQFLQGGIPTDFAGSGAGGGVVSGNDGDCPSGVGPGGKMLAGCVGPGGPGSLGSGGPVPTMINHHHQMQIPAGNLPPGIRASNMMGMSPRGATALCRPTMVPLGGGPPTNPMQDPMLTGPGHGDIGVMQCGGMMQTAAGPQQPGCVLGGGSGPLGQMNHCGGGIIGSVGGNGPKMLGVGPGAAAMMEWNKLQHQFYEDRKDPFGHLSGRQMPTSATMRPNQHQQNNTGGGGSRSQGPPPPYHQTQRSASVPIATQSPNPGSPNNPTSNLSLPSPREAGGGSSLNSPAGDHVIQSTSANSSGQSSSRQHQQLPYKQDSPVQGSNSNATGSVGTGGPPNPSRSLSQHNSNPSTPMSSHLSPNASLKDLDLGSSQGKEPNLMPVPSPQQIQYLNTFEGQELTIQKQPNSTLKDASIISPSGASNTDQRLSGTTTQSTLESRFHSAAGPLNGSGLSNSANQTGGAATFPLLSSPQTPASSASQNAFFCDSGDKSRVGNSGVGGGPSPQGSRTPSIGDVDSAQYPSHSPGINFASSAATNSSQSMMKISGGGNFMDGPKCSTTASNEVPTSGSFCVRADNLPLNPNSSCPPPAKTSHFDPISSLAQMSQQLTSNVIPSSINGGQPTTAGPGPGGGPPGGGPNVMMNAFPNHGAMIGLVANDMSMGGGGHHHVVDGMMSAMDSCSGMMGPVGPGGMGQYGMHQGGGVNNPGPGMAMGIMSGPRSMSPKLGGAVVGGMISPFGPGIPPHHRMIGRPALGGNPYGNGTNIQVKASTPNTIQYLPARPQVGGSNHPRGPPSLEFLRFSNPMSAMDGGPPQNKGQAGLPFYSNCNQMGGNPTGTMVGMNHMVDGSNGGSDGMMPISGLGGPPQSGGGGGGGQMMTQNMLMRGLRPPGQGAMIRMSGPLMGGGGNVGGPGGSGHNPHPFNNGPSNPDPSMFGPNPHQMFTGPKSGGPSGQMLPGGPPDASQPLPPSMTNPTGLGPGGVAGSSGPGGFKSSPQFVGPSTADPNYAQQYHNFQQQLYATSTRSQLSQQPGGAASGPGGPNQTNQSFYVQK